MDRAGSPADLDKRLKLHDVDVLVLPYGSAFPVDSWPRIKSFLGRGGGLAVLGGAPFHEPVRRVGDKWEQGPRSTTFAHAFRIGPAEVIDREDTWKIHGLNGITSFPEPKKTWALTLRLASNSDFKDEHGSVGPRDAVARPLVHLIDKDGIPRACPLLEIDHHHGDAAGARWVLAPTDAKLDTATVRSMVTRALQGASELRGQPVKASVDPGEPPQIRVWQHRFAERPNEKPPEQAKVVVKDDAGKEVFSAEAKLSGLPASRTDVLKIPAQSRPGLYHVTIETKDAPWEPHSTTTGFWVRDEKLMAAGPKLGVSRDWLKRDGKAFPVVGTTYMASDVHRKFLFEPNPHVWEADFADMQARGINFVRTGLWTAWARVVVDPGSLDESMLSALDAYVMSAAKHGIVVCFNIFAFLPLPFTGDNPYLDPRALEGQRALLTMLAERYRGNGWIHWDLINEPSYAKREDLWKTRPIGDEHEKRAWQSWVKARHGDDTSKLRALWREPADDTWGVPRAEDFEQKAVSIRNRPRKARDFQEFKEDVLAGWAARMRDVLRAAGNNPLVTLGQDEGGIYERPTQQFMAASLDYTAIHTWWKNDDLLWDGVMTKVPEKPSLHEETGLMRLEDPDGAPWRTPAAAALLFERKIAYAFAARGCGVVEWAWNINPYHPLDEESTIGIYRPDGTAKPELERMTAVASFLRQAAPMLDDFAPDPVLLVIPHARAFLGRVNAIDATRIAVRALAERFGVVPTAISDLKLDAKRVAGAKLIVVPSPDVLDEAAAKVLLDASKAGTKILITGAIEGDSYGRETASLKALGLLGASRPVSMEEPSGWSAGGAVLFEGLQQETTRRALGPSGKDVISGSIWHEPLPIELSRDREPYVKLLEAALAGAGIATMPGEWGLAARVLDAPRASLLVVVNERPEDAVRRVKVRGHAMDVPVKAWASRMALVDPSGRVVTSTPGDPIAIAPEK